MCLQGLLLLAAFWRISPLLLTSLRSVFDFVRQQIAPITQQVLFQSDLFLQCANLGLEGFCAAHGQQCKACHGNAQGRGIHIVQQYALLLLFERSL